MFRAELFVSPHKPVFPILVNDSFIFLLFKPKTQASSLILYLISLDAQSVTGPTCLTPNSISEPSCSPHLDHARPAAINSYLVWSGSFSTGFPASTSVLLPIHPPCSHLSSLLNMSIRLCHPPTLKLFKGFPSIVLGIK